MVHPVWLELNQITFHLMIDQECQTVLVILFTILITGMPEWHPGIGLADRPEEQNQI